MGYSSQPRSKHKEIIVFANLEERSMVNFSTLNVDSWIIDVMTPFVINVGVPESFWCCSVVMKYGEKWAVKSP
jgi:hypothetical protein